MHAGFGFHDGMKPFSDTDDIKGDNLGVRIRGGGEASPPVQLGFLSMIMPGILEDPTTITVHFCELYQTF